MKHQLYFEQFLNADIDTVWDFFSDARNLEKLTPPKMNMKVLSKLDRYQLFQGMEISYFVSPLFSIPVYWKTEIIKVDNKKEFIDIQSKGPFKLWKHTHQFIEKENGVLMIDSIVYELPFGKIGDIVNKPFVLKNLNELFEYRQSVCNNLF